MPFPRPTQSLVYLEERGKTYTCYCTSMFVLVMHNRKIRNSSVIAPPPFSTQLQTNKQKLDKRNTHSSPAGEGGGHFKKRGLLCRAVKTPTLFIGKTKIVSIRLPA